MVEEEPNLLTAAEKQRISHEVLHEVFGLGPLEPLLQDPTISDILVNGHQPGLRGAQGTARADQRALSRRRAPVAHHRQDRLPGGPPRGRIQPHGGCAPERRLARQRHHPAAGGGRAAALHPPFRHRQADAGRSGGQGRADARHDAPAGSRREGQAEHHCLRRNRRRKDHAAECALLVHLSQGAHSHH